jgi:tyrosyl-tRNA synthetase
MGTSLFQDLKDRGILHQLTDESLAKHLDNGPITLYCGFDPTSDSLHVGSLFPLLTLRRFQQAGHKPIIVLGGATGMIGDPSGKSEERNLQTEEQVERNLQAIRRVAEKFLEFGPMPHGALIVNNRDFYTGMNVLTFLREVGKHFTVNHMVQKDSVRSRMEDREHGISYTEFSYMLLQAYDFYRLHQDHHCTLQIGASDQWGNITAGTELIRRKLAHSAPAAGSASDTAYDNGSGSALAPAYGLTHPLITRPDGVKFGKTEKGAVWLSSEKTSPYQFYQFFIGSPDSTVITWLKFLTFLPLTEITELEERLKAAPEKKAAQTALARELTRRVHGEEALKRVEAATAALFSGDIRELDLGTLSEIFADAPSSTLPPSRLGEGLPLVDLLAETGLFQSKGAARKEIPAGGVYLNNERVTDASLLIRESNLIAGRALVLRKGKKNYHLVKFE